MLNYTRDLNNLLITTTAKLPLPKKSKHLKERKEGNEGKNELPYLKEKKNYTTDELFLTHNKVRFLTKKHKRIENNQSPESNGIVCTPLNQLDQKSSKKESSIEVNGGFEDESKKKKIDNVIISFKESSKSKIQLLKKLVSFYRKNQRDEKLISPFLINLSNQFNKSIIDTKEWIKYEYLRNSIESLLTAICKKMNRFINLIKKNSLDINEEEIKDEKTTSVKDTLTEKIIDYLNYSIKEEKTFVENPKIRQFIKMYNPAKRRRKAGNNFYKDRLLKRLVEMFNKGDLLVTKDRICSLFFPQNDIQSKLEDNNKKSLSIIPKDENIAIHYKDIPSTNGNSTRITKVNKAMINNHNDNLLMYQVTKTENGFPKKSNRFIIKQYNPEDYLHDIEIIKEITIKKY